MCAVVTAVACLCSCAGLTQMQDTAAKFDEGVHATTAAEIAPSPRVRTVLAGRPHIHGEVERIAYPADIARIRAEERDRAREVQQANASKFLDAFARGLAVTGFERSDNEGTYLLEPWQ